MTVFNKTKKRWRALAFLVSVLVPLTSHAQIDYTPQCLSITGNDSTETYGITVTDMNGVRLTNFNQNPTVIGSVSNDNIAYSHSSGSSVSGPISTPTTCYFLINLESRSPLLCGSSNSVYFLNPVSNRYNNIYAGSIYNLSDMRAKENIRDLDLGLRTLMSLRPVTYRWKGSFGTDSAQLNDGNNIGVIATGSDLNKEQIGLIAQEVEEIIPQAVETGEGGAKALNYTALIPVLIKSVQELEYETQYLRDKVNALESALDSKVANIGKNKILYCTPNPTKGDLTVIFSLEENISDAKILVSGISGNVSIEKKCNAEENKIQMSLSGLVPGVYAVTLIVNGSAQDSKQIILSK